MKQIRIGSLTVSRLIAGSNPISGFSHGGSTRSEQMLNYFTMARAKALLRDCESCGVTAMAARCDAFIVRLFKEHWAEGGTVRWIAQTAPEHRDPKRNVAMALSSGAAAVFIHGGEVDRMIDADEQSRLAQLVDQVRAAGKPVGAASHRPENLLLLQTEGVRLDFFLPCLYRLDGYKGDRQTDLSGETFSHDNRAAALRVLRQLNAPCIVYKVLGAGRLSLTDGLADVLPALRSTDGLLMGFYPPDHSDIVGTAVRALEDMDPA